MTVCKNMIIIVYVLIFPVGCAVTNLTLCRSTDSIQSWDKIDYRLCDDRICNSLLSTFTVDPMFTRQYRFNTLKLATYLKDIRQNVIEGWLAPIHIFLAFEFSKFQHSNMLYGTVGEIGVFHGKYLYPIIGFAYKNEPAFGVDMHISQFIGTNKILPDQFQNYYTTTSIENMKNIHLLGNNSQTLFCNDFLNLNLPLARFISVDGSHTMEHTLRDLNLAMCLVRDGAIVVLDDFHNSVWLGVTSAAVLFTHSQTRLVPFLCILNKLYFTTPSHHTIMLKRVQGMGFLSCTASESLHPSQTSIGPWRVLQCSPKGKDNQVIATIASMFDKHGVT